LTFCGTTNEKVNEGRKEMEREEIKT